MRFGHPHRPPGPQSWTARRTLRCRPPFRAHRLPLMKLKHQVHAAVMLADLEHRGHLGWESGDERQGPVGRSGSFAQRRINKAGGPGDGRRPCGPECVTGAEQLAGAGRSALEQVVVGDRAERC